MATPLKETDIHHTHGAPIHPGGSAFFFGGVVCGPELSNSNLIPGANHVYEGDVTSLDIVSLVLPNDQAKTKMQDTPMFIGSISPLVNSAEYYVMGAPVKILRHPSGNGMLPYPAIMIHQAVRRQGDKLDSIPGALCADGVVEAEPMQIKVGDKLTGYDKITLDYSPKSGKHATNEMPHQMTVFFNNKLAYTTNKATQQSELWLGANLPLSVAGPLVVEAEANAQGQITSTSWGLFLSGFMPNPLPSSSGTKRMLHELEQDPNKDTQDKNNKDSTGGAGSGQRSRAKRVHV